jgi:hypothetical protein
MPERYTYKTAEASGRQPSVVLSLPWAFKFLEAPLNRLILRLDIQEEAMDRLERKVDRILVELNVPLESPK